MTNVKAGNIKYVHYLMVKETMEEKQSTLVQIVTLKKWKKEKGFPYLKVRFLVQKICLEQFSVII